MSTFCHGVASAQSLDKSGEIVDIKGLDITSLAKTGVLNYEHKSDIPGQICGKILTAKKIFSKDDCSNDNELYFWNKTKVPFVYITAELLDDYCQSGKDAAGILKYDHDKRKQGIANGKPYNDILGFSIEGSEIPNSRGSNRMVVARGIARKTTLTASPCNSQCIAELLEEKQESKIKDDFEELFRSSDEAINLFKSGEGDKLYQDFLIKKSEDTTWPEKEALGTTIGRTKSGKQVYSHGPIGAYSFNPAEHKEAAEHHARAIVTATNPKLIDNHVKRMQAHNNAALTGGSQQNEAARSLNAKDKSPQATGKQSIAKKEKICELHKSKVPGSKIPTAKEAAANKAAGKPAYSTVGGIPKFGPIEKPIEKPIKKAVEAGSYNAAPSTLTNGAAYQTEQMSAKPATIGAEEHTFQGTKKKDWKKRAKDDYENWPHKEKFEKFMSQRMPHLAMGEIRAIGRVLSLKKSMEFEKSLESLVLRKSEKEPKLGNHFLFSAENPMYPHKNELKMDHKQTLAHLKSKGYKAHEVKGHYGAPETSIMVHNVNPKQAEELHGIASRLGQDSSIYSRGGKHEMRFHHGENAGKKVHGEGTVFYTEKPKDFYTTLPNGKHFTHNFNF